MEFNFLLCGTKQVDTFRTRLIADVVTGKVNVREVAAELPDEVDNMDDLVNAFDPLSDEVNAASMEIRA